MPRSGAVVDERLLSSIGVMAAMDIVRLNLTGDVYSALNRVRRGESVTVQCGTDVGEGGRIEPRVELMQELLDRAVLTYDFEVVDIQRIRHPWLGRRYLHRCVVRPRSNPDGLAGVREPRQPFPSDLPPAALYAE